MVKKYYSQIIKGRFPDTKAQHILALGVNPSNTLVNGENTIDIETIDDIDGKTYTLTLQPFRFAWQRKALDLSKNNLGGYYNSGRYGAIVEFFGWPHEEIAEEAEKVLAGDGWMGLKVFPPQEQLMALQPYDDCMNPWYFMYQPVSYNLDGRAGTREQFQNMIDRSRDVGVRVYVDLVLNHMTGGGNDSQCHRNPQAGCANWPPKQTSGSYMKEAGETGETVVERSSPMYTSQFTYIYNHNTEKPPGLEFPGAAFGPLDFHTEKALNSWTDINIMTNSWLVGLSDLATERANVRYRQAAYIVDLISRGCSGFRIDAAKHMSPSGLIQLFKLVRELCGGKLPVDFCVWLEVITGGESALLWNQDNAMFGYKFWEELCREFNDDDDVAKIKMWDGLYPKEPTNNSTTPYYNKIIQNDDHDQQNDGSSSRDMNTAGVILTKAGPGGFSDWVAFEQQLFNLDTQRGVPLRNVLSSYWPNENGDIHPIPDGLSVINSKTEALFPNSLSNLSTYDYHKASTDFDITDTITHENLGGNGSGYTRAHRNRAVVEAMNTWVKGSTDLSSPPAFDAICENYSNRYNRNNRYSAKNYF